ncbi:hemolysin III family protein [Agrococcus sp. Marseille-Q4369]|uniref:PAQR family membrane homeostasis protein TrhA n=1 Tax=Agrococcus sp. Marseille-Q4369 TaxID=2810513 RepID=UPI001B8BE1F2|nr:hemolysin III family protein [Agrococcus sp. Marseille-Q4369]QUW20107.1 hemolysin III family protein [Agrococcus sp. Marseille-Q4369]
MTSDPEADGLRREPDPAAADDVPHLPLIEAAGDAIAEAEAEAKPSWRGWIHAATAPLALVAGIVLVLVADGASARLSTAVYALSSVLMFGVSAVYHRFTWQERTRVLLKRFDHANIFLLIAGSYTPISLLTLPSPTDWILLTVIWGGALLGIAFRVFWIGAPRWLYVPIYLALGWAAVAFLPQIWAANALTAMLVIAGGLAYTVGAIIYGMKRPNPVPGHFGFHEIFHACTFIAFVCHFTAILIVAVAPPA